ncbi:MAG: hypothetical protein HY965_00380, partial [Ignavibacteriales bacterium]|nr:hypothetical protein [Ignavibacteriales bacterium]
MKTKNIFLSFFITVAALLLVVPVFFCALQTGNSTADFEKKFRPGDWFHLQRAYPYAEIPQDLFLKAMAQKAAMPVAKNNVNAVWEFAGPDNIGGRITALEADYTNPSIIYIGAAAGGVFKSTDSGTTWTPQTDNYPSLSIGALAMDPVDPAVLYCGTGEANISIDSYPGIGLLKTTNGGTTWLKSGLDSTRHIADIEVHPLNTKSVFVAASGALYSKGPHRGIFRSTNAGKDWTKVLYVNDSTSAIDVALDPLDTSRVYAAVWERLRGATFRKAAGINSGIFVSNDGGWTWARMANGLPAQNAATGRISIAVAPSNPNYIYALYQNAGTANGTIGQFDAFYRSTNKGQSWAAIFSSSE